MSPDIVGTLRNPGISYGAAPPATPVDGQLWVLPADATNGAMWMFRYRSASASTYKWEFVGGAPVWALVATDESLGASTGGWLDATTQGPQFSIPRNGEYMALGGLIVYGAAAGTIYMGIGVDNTTAAVNVQTTIAAGGSAGMSVQTKLTINASSVAKMRYLQTAAANHVVNRWLTVTPVRVS